MLPIGSKSNPADIEINTSCTVTGGAYYYGNINITSGGKLIFADPMLNVDFWTTAIIIENGGSMLAGVVNAGMPNEQIVPIGTMVAGAKVTIHLYGAQQTNLLHAVGVKCATTSVLDLASMRDPRQPLHVQHDDDRAGGYPDYSSELV